MNQAVDRPEIEVTVKVAYRPGPSRPEDHHFVFSYTITIANLGEEPARLVARYWRITDANLDLQEVTGVGVVGEQPRLLPGEDFTYTSGVVLATETGTMEGSYQMQRDDGEIFEAPIPMFALLPPHVIH